MNAINRFIDWLGNPACWRKAVGTLFNNRRMQRRTVYPRNEVVAFSGRTMGTAYHITAHGLSGGTTPETLIHAVDSVLNDINNKMSMYMQDSELSRFNVHISSEPFAVSAETAEVFRISQQVSEISGGAFDITIGPLVRAWGFGPEKISHNPDDTTVAALRRQVAWNLVEVQDNNMLVKKCPHLNCDLSAVAKGYGVDKTAEALDLLDIENYLVEVGGEVRTKGVNSDGQPWRIAIEKPMDEGQQPQRVVELSGMSLATSGDYRIFRVENEKRISHTIDPRTGHPVTNNLASASVIHPSCTWADAYATVLSTLGYEEGHIFAQQKHLAAYLMVRKTDSEFDTCQTKEFEKYIHRQIPK